LPYKTQAQLNGNHLTEDGPGGDGLLVDPEGHLGQDDGHDAGDVGLDQEEAHLPLQVEVHCHDDVFTCQRDNTQHNNKESLDSISEGLKGWPKSNMVAAAIC